MSRSSHSARFATLALLLAAPHLSSGSRPAPGDACSLLAKEDAAAALGEPVTGPKAVDAPASGGGKVTGCEYSGSGTHRAQLNLTVLPANLVPMYREMCAKQKNDGLAGLGDVACWSKGKHEELHVLKGTAFVSIVLRRSGDPTEPIKALMTKALGHLK